MSSPSGSHHPHIVIVGAGFGGLACAQALGGKPVRVTIVDRRNYHLFVPLLYQVATAALSPADIARPIRRILGRYKNIEVVLGTVTGIDTTARRVRLSNGSELAYDRLVVATGSDYSYFRPSGMGRVRARAVLARGCPPHPRAAADVVRACRGGARSGRAGGADDDGDRRRRAYRRRNGGRGRRTRRSRAGARLPQHRSAPRQDHADRGGAADSFRLSREALGVREQGAGEARRHRHHQGSGRIRSTPRASWSRVVASTPVR